jgi:hypothetical protein
LKGSTREELGYRSGSSFLKLKERKIFKMEKIKNYIKDHPELVKTAAHVGLGFVAGYLTHKVCGPQWVPFTGCLHYGTTLTDEQYAGAQIAWEAVERAGLKLCKHA